MDNRKGKTCAFKFNSGISHNEVIPYLNNVKCLINMCEITINMRV